MAEDDTTPDIPDPEDAPPSGPIPVEERDEDGRVILSGQSIDGKFHGESIVYGERGTPVTRTRLRADEIHGEVRQYNPDGSLAQVAVYANGLQDGPTTFYTNNRPVARLTYRAGILEGPALFYNDNGTVAAAMTYRAGKREGEAQYFSPNQRLIRRETYVADQQEGPAEGYFEDGAIQERSNYRNGLLDGELRRYYPSGKLMQHAVYQAGLLVAPLRTFAENGKEISVVMPLVPAS